MTPSTPRSPAAQRPAAHDRAARTAAACAAVALAVTALTGCTHSVGMRPAADAASPRCADVTVRLPDTIAGLARRSTDAQATAAWGRPAEVLLRCGVTPPGPTTAHCVDALGVDWVIDDSDQKAVTYTTFGRSPAVQVVLDHTAVSDADVLGAIKPAVTSIPQTRHCIGPGDAGTGATAAPTPTPTAPTPTTTPAPTR